MTETPVLFGPDRRLLGVVTVPATAAPTTLACLLVNAGVIHRIGPHRINVKAARALAQVGIASLRFDLSGLGDSPAARSQAHFQDQAVHDMQAAMNYLEASAGIRRFLVFGICSGAANAYALALADPRVVGILMFDGFAHPTIKTHLVRRWLRFRAMSWRSLASNVLSKLQRLSARPAAAAQQAMAAGVASATPSRLEFRQALNKLTERGVSIYLVFSGSFLESYNHPSQLQDAFAGASFLRHVRSEFMPDVDHTVTSLAVQHKLISRLCGWAGDVMRRQPE
jgi:pimeloyl-ACP methyl ester carboxylesterase